ncbi:hypothetical protein [Limoniibacter endophyticus]|uniref:Uncharacterized protein n=1 Tax=Limoniibacter endophyticus TaxID=1565040 RepID=A0A8J3GHJ8_9HYPH|nr:hypothetical protein [Limoniibacter endophyticus]GHC79591.1 hypothetical protein GCM10010136_32280 [Limoniibacter endophyticus]
MRISQQPKSDRYDWTYTHICKLSGAQPVVDLDVELSIDVELSGGELTIDVRSVYVEGVNLATGDIICRQLGAAIIEAADKEIADGGWLFGEISEREGYSLRGHPSDPDAYVVRAA